MFQQVSYQINTNVFKIKKNYSFLYVKHASIWNFPLLPLWPYTHPQSYYLNEFSRCFTVFKLWVAQVPQCAESHCYWATQCLRSQGHLHLLVVEVDMLVCDLVCSMQSVLRLHIVETNDVFPVDGASGVHYWAVCLQNQNQNLNPFQSQLTQVQTGKCNASHAVITM